MSRAAIGPVRRALVAVGLAACGVVALRSVGFEVYRVPSPSMQPTLLGSDVAGVHDRVLVDKLWYERHEPRRWEVAVFRPPLQRLRTFSKRVVGLPGERLMIAGGNVYRVFGDGAGQQLRTLRKPPTLQAALWREVYPARRLARGEQRALDGSFVATPAGRWRERDDGVLLVELEADETSRLVFDDAADGALVDRVWDGCPPAVARRLRERFAAASLLGELVPDARIQVGLWCSAADVDWALAVEVVRPGLPRMVYALEAEAGSARLVVRRGGDAAAVFGSPPLPWPATPGVEQLVAFAHVDDELVAWRDGVEVARVDVTAHGCRQGCELPDPCGMGPALPTAEQRARAYVALSGRGRAELRRVRIWRDQHYTRGALAAGQVVEVPARHYFLLGDNPLQSVDSRHWQAVVAHARRGGLAAPGAADASRLVGSWQPGRSDAPSALGENPLRFATRPFVLFTDANGEVHPLRLHAAQLARGEDDGLPGSMTVAPAPFVPRDHLLGRVLLRCWPLPPFGPFRTGVVR